MNGQFEIGDFAPEKLFIGLSCILGLLFAFISESPLNPFISVIHWQIQTTGAVFVILITHMTLFSNTNLLISFPWVRVAISGFLGAMIFSPIALLSDIYIGGEALNDKVSTEIFQEMLAIIPPMTIGWLAINAPWLMGYRLNRPLSLKKDEPAHVSPLTNTQFNIVNEPEFLSETKLSSSKDILYIKSELHYLNVVTENDKQLILYSLKDAISQLERSGIHGTHCHRGYWVANDAINSAQRTGRQAVLTLKNGKEIPVSRTNTTRCLKMFA